MTTDTSEVIYLDHAATTPMCDEAIEAMLPFLRDRFGNPSGAYGAARSVRRAIDDARDEFAELVGCSGGEVIFTSGGTESDNLAVLGAAQKRTGNVAVTAGEHKAVLAPAHDHDATIINIDARGVIDLDHLRSVINDETVLVSAMAVNNEVGVIQPVAEIASIVRDVAKNALFHCDAVQAFPFLDVASLTKDCDLVTYSAHKFAGPKGVGALVIRGNANKRLSAQHVGGSQEREIRPGTENVAGIIAMVAAAKAWTMRRVETTARVTALRNKFADGVMAIYPQAKETAPRELRIAGNCHMRFPEVSAEELLMVLDGLSVCASAGSACASGAIEPSHVLLAMGLSPSDAKEALRFSLGWTTTDEEIDRALIAMGTALQRLGRPVFLRD